MIVVKASTTRGVAVGGVVFVSGGLGRAAIESARALKVRTLGVQHGILYPNYYSYERTTADVALGTPIADTTAMYGASR